MVKKLQIKYRKVQGNNPFCAYAANVCFKNAEFTLAYIHKSYANFMGTCHVWEVEMLRPGEDKEVVDTFDRLSEAKEAFEARVFEYILENRRQLWPERENTL